jgi:hypothetical protein
MQTSQTCLYTCQKKDSMLHVSIIGCCIPVVVHNICIWCVGTCESCVCCCISCIIGQRSRCFPQDWMGFRGNVTPVVVDVAANCLATNPLKPVVDVECRLGSNKCKQVTTSNTRTYIYIWGKHKNLQKWRIYETSVLEITNDQFGGSIGTPFWTHRPIATYTADTTAGWCLVFLPLLALIILLPCAPGKFWDGW